MKRNKLLYILGVFFLISCSSNVPPKETPKTENTPIVFDYSGAELVLKAEFKS